MSFSEKLLARKYPVWIFPVSLFIIACLVELIAVLKLNGNKFIYTLDDPYIHLALSENIARGHYGVNIQEFSAPSSSIIWPFLLAPFAGFSWFEYVPFLLNFLFSIATIFVFDNILQTVFKKNLLEQHHGWVVFKTVLGIAFIFIVNSIALTFIGMEHALQILCTVSIIAGIIIKTETGLFPKFALVALILAPSVRYENLALSGCGLLFLMYHKEYKKAFTSAAIIGFVIIGFSLYLYSNGVGFMPTSIVVKSRTAWQANKVIAVLKIIYANVSSRQGAILLGLLALLLKPAFTSSQVRIPALIVSISLIFHLTLGDCTYSRYTNYITAAAIITLLYCYADTLHTFFFNRNFLLKTSAVVAATLSIGATFITDAAFTPIASNNIYEQQYQMHRFVTEYYRQPIAVNDLGYVSFKNDKYVLDLWGLASRPAFEVRIQERMGKDMGDWMNKFTRERGIKFAMIYDVWFPKIPKNWRKVATIHLSRMLVSSAQSSVDFYSLDESQTPALLEKLKAFKTTLPAGVQLNIIE